MMIGLGARLGLAEVETYHIGRGGLSWASQADIQNGTVGVEGALQPLELRSGQNLMELLRGRRPDLAQRQPQRLHQARTAAHLVQRRPPSTR